MKLLSFSFFLGGMMNFFWVDETFFEVFFLGVMKVLFVRDETFFVWAETFSFG